MFECVCACAAMPLHFKFAKQSNGSKYKVGLLSRCLQQKKYKKKSKLNLNFSRNSKTEYKQAADQSYSRLRLKVISCLFLLIWPNVELLSADLNVYFLWH